MLETVNGSVEYIRFYGLSYWSLRFDTARWISNLTLSMYFDRLAQRARLFRPEYSFVFLSYDSRIFVQAFRQRFSANATNRTILLLNSSQLRISVQLVFIQTPKPRSYINSMNFTFYLSNTTNQTSLLYLNLTAQSIISNGLVLLW